jgi:hypothetical protein
MDKEADKSETCQIFRIFISYRFLHIIIPPCSSVIKHERILRFLSGFRDCR